MAEEELECVKVPNEDLVQPEDVDVNHPVPDH